MNPVLLEGRMNLFSSPFMPAPSQARVAVLARAALVGELAFALEPPEVRAGFRVGDALYLFS